LVDSKVLTAVMNDIEVLVYMCVMAACIPGMIKQWITWVMYTRIVDNSLKQNNCWARP